MRCPLSLVFAGLSLFASGVYADPGIDHLSNETVFVRFNGSDEDLNEAAISVRQERAGWISIKGHSFWVPLEGIPHSGELNGSAPVKDGLAHYVKGACSLTIHLMNDKLIVTNDNQKCGGLNVTFNGIYKKETISRSGDKQSFPIHP